MKVAQATQIKHATRMLHSTPVNLSPSSSPQVFLRAGILPQLKILKEEFMHKVAIKIQATGCDRKLSLVRLELLVEM